MIFNYHLVQCSFELLPLSEYLQSIPLHLLWLFAESIYYLVLDYDINSAMRWQNKIEVKTVFL